MYCSSDYNWMRWRQRQPKKPTTTISPALVFSRLINSARPPFESLGDDDGDYYYLFGQATIFCWSFHSNQVIKLFAIYTMPEHRGKGHARRCLNCVKEYADRINGMEKYDGKDIEGKLNLVLFPCPFVAPGWTNEAEFSSDRFHQICRNSGFRDDTDYRPLDEYELAGQMDWVQLRGMYWRNGFTECRDDGLNYNRSARAINRKLYSMIYPFPYLSE